MPDEIRPPASLYSSSRAASASLGKTVMPLAERRYAWRPDRKSLPRSLVTWIRRSVRSFRRSVDSEMIPSATANSGASRISCSLYSPIQNVVAGKAVSSAARSCRNRRKSRASSPNAASALKLSIAMIPGRRSLITVAMRSVTAASPFSPVTGWPRSS